jgi:hypothetical protein
MERSLYLLLSLFLLGIWGILFLLRSDLRQKLWIMSFIGAVVGPLSERLYFRDYWRPPLTLPPLPLEDALFGFAIAGIAATIFDVVAQTSERVMEAPQRGLTVGMVPSLPFVLLVFTVILGVNSVLVSTAAFLALSLLIAALRPDLLLPSLLSGLLCILIIAPLYAILLGIAPIYLERVWLLAGTPWGRTVFGIPATELLWYFSWGCLGSVIYPFAKGLGKVPVPSK